MGKRTKKIAVITGATSGIGELAAIELAKQGIQLVLTARSEERAEATLRRIREVSPEAEVKVYYGNLSVLKEVQRMGEEISKDHPVINILINNAGLHAFEQRITAEGYPEMIAVNYFAPWCLTQQLKSSLQASGQARVINVASEASRNYGKFKLPGDLTDTTPFSARGSSAIYGKTKLYNIMFTKELARRWAGTGIEAFALNPGFNVTGLGRELRFAALLEKILKFLRLGDPRYGAEIIVRLATAAEYKGHSGGYYNVKTGTELVPVSLADDPFMQKKLWEETEKLLKNQVGSDLSLQV
ncbi:short-chain dehydrogenase [Paenibacillus yonginensis]|uniref:Short-chain dehydrogenase n=1 Tax=Paenibacillus yonginensis TaxID=1462996 RepID=A0A1B1N3Z3_9BACL|nr:SDR family NAD(P)-dependent oxidoreductase [Paenibacillus yonginensis]ANS76161.1 short-chain dehydrogenase [Paenibacillus yonginensis]